MRAALFGLLGAVVFGAAAQGAPAPAARAFERLCIATHADPVAAQAAAKAAGWQAAYSMQAAMLKFMGNVHGKIVVLRPHTFRAVLLQAKGDEANQGCGVVANDVLAPNSAAMTALLGEPQVLANDGGLRWEAAEVGGVLRPFSQLSPDQQAEITREHRKVGIVAGRDDTTGIMLLVYIKNPDPIAPAAAPAP